MLKLAGRSIARGPENFQQSPKRRTYRTPISGPRLTLDVEEFLREKNERHGGSVTRTPPLSTIPAIVRRRCCLDPGIDMRG